MSSAVLIAEDDENDAILLQRSISRVHTGYEVSIVRNGEEAMDYLQGTGAYSDRDRYPFPSFIWLDLRMPRMGGFEVLLWLKDHPGCSVIPCIVWSASREPGDIERAYQLGANTVFNKPTNAKEWDSLVADIFKYWARSERPRRANCGPMLQTRSY